MNIGTLIAFILYMKKQRHGDVNYLAPGLTAIK